MVDFYYRPIIAANLTGHFPTDFENAFPVHDLWLRQRDIPCRITNYVWPDFLTSLLHLSIRERMCEFFVQVPEHYAEEFAALATPYLRADHRNAGS